LDCAPDKIKQKEKGTGCVRKKIVIAEFAQFLIVAYHRHPQVAYAAMIFSKGSLAVNALVPVGNKINRR
jgi:hypothetical protein